MLEYKIEASHKKQGSAFALANKSIITFDATSGRDDTLPNPAELLLTALAACILKNVERYSEILHYDYSSAQITITGERNDNPPFMSKIDYVLKIETSVDERKLNNWHKNILKFGTISNTLSKACELNGKVEYLKNDS